MLLGLAHLRVGVMSSGQGVRRCLAIRLRLASGCRGVVSCPPAATARRRPVAHLAQERTATQDSGRHR